MRRYYEPDYYYDDAPVVTYYRRPYPYYSAGFYPYWGPRSVIGVEEAGVAAGAMLDGAVAVGGMVVGGIAVGDTAAAGKLPLKSLKPFARVIVRAVF